MKLNDNQLHILRHMLGINTPWDKFPKPFRNHAAVNPGDPVYLELERLGAVERFESKINSEYHYYRCTEAGRSAACASHRKIRLSSAKRRYSAFLEMCEIAPDLTFHEFLTGDEWKEAREAA